jgi:hypothetical protein
MYNATDQQIASVDHQLIPILPENWIDFCPDGAFFDVAWYWPSIQAYAVVDIQHGQTIRATASRQEPNNIYAWFDLESDGHGNWRIRSKEGKYLRVDTKHGHLLCADAKKYGDPTTLFTLSQVWPPVNPIRYVLQSEATHELVAIDNERNGSIYTVAGLPFIDMRAQFSLVRHLR